MTRHHHVANGSSTTVLIERAGLPGSRSIWADPLHDGPVPLCASDRELVAVRARHLAEPADRVGDVIAELERWRAAIDDVSTYDELVLWFEHDLFDQLNLIQLLDRIGAATAQMRPRAATLICIGSFPGRPAFKGLGELEPEEIASLFETRRPIVAEQLALAGRAWSALRSPDPRAIVALLETDTKALPFLAPALRRHLEELPWTRDGLSRSERRILDLAAGGPISTWDAFRRVSEGETAFYLADLSFWRLVESLAAPACAPALLDVQVDDRRGTALPRGSLSTTDRGRDVLDGALDRVAACGIDRWLGGVRLEGRGPVWRSDHGSVVVVHA